MCACPLVVAYRVAPLTAWIARAFRLLKTPFVALPNILADRELAPELLQEQASGENLGRSLLDLYDRPRRAPDHARRVRAPRGPRWAGTPAAGPRRRVLELAGRD